MFFNSGHLDEQEFPNLSEFENDLDRAEYLQDTLTNHATNDGPSNNEITKF